MNNKEKQVCSPIAQSRNTLSCDWNRIDVSTCSQNSPYLRHSKDFLDSLRLKPVEKYEYKQEDAQSQTRYTYELIQNSKKQLDFEQHYLSEIQNPEGKTCDIKKRSTNIQKQTSATTARNEAEIILTSDESQFEDQNNPPLPKPNVKQLNMSDESTMQNSYLKHSTCIMMKDQSKSDKDHFLSETIKECSSSSSNLKTNGVWGGKHMKLPISMPKASCSSTSTKQIHSGECKIITFRDIHKKITITADGSTNEGMENESTASEYFTEVDANQSGRKRRYDKLMKKLEDSEKRLDDNLKQIFSNTEEKVIKENNSKIMDMLCLHEKKKYESLINYQRDQSKENQKNFMDLLPDKVEEVKANIEAQLDSRPVIMTEKRPRGRPCKEIKSQNIIKKKKTREPTPKVVRPQKAKSKAKKTRKAMNRGFPLKFPKSLLPDPKFQPSPKNIMNFRLGIVGKDGHQQFVELSKDTLNGLYPYKSKESKIDDSLAISDKQSKRKKTEISSAQSKREKLISSVTFQDLHEPFRRDDEEDPLQDSVQKKVSAPQDFLKETEKAPCMSITLPSISALQHGYELISLSQTVGSNSSKVGDVMTEPFFIPQSTFLKDGKTGMIMVGPFLVVQDPKPHLALVGQGRQIGQPMILMKKLSSPGHSPPRDFRLKKAKEKPAIKIKDPLSQKENVRIALVDHDYYQPRFLKESGKKLARGVAKQYASSKFIDVRFDKITQEEGQATVTIEGHNALQQAKQQEDATAQLSARNTEAGIPVVYSLGQVMTPTLKAVAMRQEREKILGISLSTCDYRKMLFPLHMMGDVVMEVIIPPAGNEFVYLPKWRKGDKEMWLSLEDIDLETDTDVNTVNNNTKSSTNNTGVEFINTTNVIDVESENVTKNLDNKYEKKDLILTRLEKSPRLSNVDANDKSQEETREEQEAATEIKIENEASVTIGSRPGLPCCRLCLRLFPSTHVLFTHVRTVHSSQKTEDPMYLEELRVDSRMNCPICYNPPVFLSTPYKLRRHLDKCHGIIHQPDICKFCRQEFSDSKELSLHIELNHGAYVNAYQLINPSKAPKHSDIRGKKRHRPPCLPSTDYISCNRCNILFLDRAALISHTLALHPELNQPDVCCLCDLEFESPTSLGKHLKLIHEQTRNGALRCPLCPEWFFTIEAAVQHKKTLHSALLPVHCPFCGQGFEGMQGMYSHVQSQHLVTEHFPCPQCPLSFPTLHMLTDHGRKDHNILPSVLKSLLNSNPSPSFCCPFCTNNPFTRTDELAVHVVNDHRGLLLPVKCNWCMQSFVSELIAIMHMNEAHIAPHNQDIKSYDKNYDMASTSHQYMDSLEDGVSVVVGGQGSQQYSQHPSESLRHDQLSQHSHNPHRMNPHDHNQHNHMADTADMMETHKASSFLEQLADQEEPLDQTLSFYSGQDSLVGMPQRHHDAMLAPMHLLTPPDELQAMNYLDTLTDDNIVAGQDRVVDTLQGVNQGGLEQTSQGMCVSPALRVNQAYQFPPPGSLAQQYHSMTDLVMPEAGGLHGAPLSMDGRGSETLTIDAAEFAQIFHSAL